MILDGRNLMDVTGYDESTSNYDFREHEMDLKVEGNTLTSEHGYNTSTQYYDWGTMQDLNWTQAEIQAYIDTMMAAFMS